MYAHASMNRIFRLVWSELLGTWVAVAENARGKGKGGGRRKLLVPLLAALGLGLAGAAHAAAPPLPTGGQVVAGTVTVGQNGATMTITQRSERGAIDWQSFNVAKDARVKFEQPGRESVTLNRVLNAQPSQILGQIEANGQIFLSNPNGVYFGKSASVNVGGLVATTHRLSHKDVNRFTDANDVEMTTFHFVRDGATGTVRNDGTLRADLGGYIALLAPEVRNNGVIMAQAGTVALAAGQGFKLKFDHGLGLADVIVKAGHIAALVENGNAVLAPDGLVILSAQAGRQLLGAVVNSGNIEANGLSADGGRIVLRASDSITNNGVISADAGQRGKGGQVTLITDLSNMDGVTASSGRISVRGGRDGGDGGFIETSAARVALVSAAIDASAAHGSLGSLLIDPKDYTVAASGGDMTGAALGDLLGRASVELQSSQGKGGDGGSGSGSIHINDAVSWGADSILTLTASHDVNVNASIRATGANAGLAINPNTANGGEAASGKGAFVLGKGVQIDLPNVSASSQTALVIDHKIYTVINNLGVEGSKTGTDLQGIQKDLKGYYALGRNLDAAATKSWNGNKGFDPLGPDSAAAFAGQLDGLGHNIAGLVVKRKDQTGVALFGYTSGSSVIRNIALQGAVVEGMENTGALVGVNLGSISNSSASGTVESNGSFGGGLVGTNAGMIRDSSTNVTMTSNGSFFGKLDSFGGLVGLNSGTIVGSGATGDVSCMEYTTNSCGGLVGWNTGAVAASYASGNVSSKRGGYIGGLIGYSGAVDGNKDHSVSGSYATGSVTAFEYAGGLIGRATGRGSISDSYAKGKVRAGAYIGGLIGYIEKSSVTNTYASGKVETGNPFATPRALVGAASDVKFAHNYWDISANPGMGPGDGLNADDATGWDAIAMKDKASFSGFNFGSTWRLRAAQNDVAPCLAALANCVATPLAVKLTPSQSASIYGEDVGAIGTVLYRDSTALKTADLDRMKVALSGDAVIGDAPTRGSNAGVYHMVYASGLKLSGADANDYVLVPDVASDYTVNKRSLTLVGQRVYDNTKVFTAGDLAAATGLLVGDCGKGLAACGLVGTGHVPEKDVAAGQQQLSFNADFGLLGGTALDTNYTLDTRGALATIVKRGVTATADSLTREYDGSNAAKVTLKNVGVGGETVMPTFKLATFDNKNAGEQKTVVVEGIALSKEDAGNYFLNSDAITVTGNSITRRPLTVLASGASRVYDGSQDAAVPLRGDALPGDVLTLRADHAQFDAKDVGNDLAISLGEITLGGGDAGNYQLVGPLPRVTGNITKRVLEITGSADSRVYDGTRNVTNLKWSDNRIGNDDLSLGSPTAEFASKDVGEHKALVISGVKLGGGDAGNYTVAVKGEASITARPLNVLSLTGRDKIYDGNAKATVQASDDHLKADAVALNVDAAFADKQAGSDKAIVIKQIFLTGKDANNYELSTTLPAGPVQATVKKAPLVVTPSAKERFYDGSTDVADFELGDNRIVNDKLTLTHDKAAYADKHAAVDKPITVGIKLDGDDAGNYELQSAIVEARATIKPLSLTVIAHGKGRDFNGTANMPVDLEGNALKNDNVVLSYQHATAVDANAAAVGVHNVSVTGIAIAGEDARNYRLDNVTATATVTIKAVAINPDLVPLPPAPGGTTLGDKPVDAGKGVGGLDGAGRPTNPSKPLNPDSGANAGNDGTTSPAKSDAGFGNGNDGATDSVKPDTGASDGDNGSTSPTKPDSGTSHGGGNGGAPIPVMPNTGTDHGNSSGGTINPAHQDIGTGDASDDTDATGAGEGKQLTSVKPSGNEAPHNEGRHDKGDGRVADDEPTVDDQHVTAHGSLPVTTVATTFPAHTKAAGAGHAGGLAATGLRVDVKVDHAPLEHLPGLVTVSIPKEMLGAQGHFTFSLPAELVQKLAGEGAEARVTLTDGDSLPAWLHYAPRGKMFIGTAAPAQALPLEVLVEIGAQHWKIKLTERSDHQASQTTP